MDGWMAETTIETIKLPLRYLHVIQKDSK